MHFFIDLKHRCIFYQAKSKHLTSDISTAPNEVIIGQRT